ncbi:MAG: hypothetical protein HW421_3756 [Ignavibacteria bacterium]|nr:hypothetical protein [Ignavibacteria bacterium]
MSNYSIFDYKRIAILQTAFLGDVALTLPLAQTIKNFNTNAEIYFITTPKAAPIARLASVIKEAIIFDKRSEHKGFAGIKNLAHKLEELNIDCILVPHRSLRSTLVAYYSKANLSVGFNKCAFSFLYSIKIPYYFHQHETERNLSLLKVFKEFKDISPAALDEVELSISQYDQKYANELLNAKGILPENKLIAIAPGSVWETKRWQESSFQQLCSKLSIHGYKCIIIGSGEDAPICERIAQNTGAVSLAGECSIPQTISLLQRTQLLISNDSAPVHFAGLAGCPVIAIFGPTSPMFGFGPKSKNSRILGNNELSCRPCSIHGSRKCPIKTHICMKSITADDAYNAALQILDLHHTN